LPHAIARETRVRVTVDEARDRTQPATVHLFDVAVERIEVAHAADRGDGVSVAEHIRVLKDLGLSERAAAERGASARRSRELSEVADEHAGLTARGAHSRSDGGSGTSSPCSCAAATA